MTYCPDYKFCLKNGPECYDGQNGFLFTLNNKGKFSTYCSLETERDDLVTQCKNKHPEDHHKAHCCSALLMKDNWEIKEDYPWAIK